MLSNYYRSRYTRSAPTSVALEPIVVFGSSRVSTATSYKSAKSMTDSQKQSKKFPKLSTIASITHSHSTNTYQSQPHKPSNLVPPPLSSVLTPNKAVTESSSLTSPSLSHRSYTPSSHYTSEPKPPFQPQPPPIQPPSIQPQPQYQLQQQYQQQQQQTPLFQQQQQQQQFQYPYNPYQLPIQHSPRLEQQQQQQLYPPYYYNYPPVPPPLQPQQPQYPFQQPIYYPPTLQNNSTIAVPQSEVPNKIIYREVQEEKPLSPRQYFIYRNGCALKVMKWYRKQKQIREEKERMKEAESKSTNESNEINPHAYNEMIIRQADQYLLDQQTRKNRSLLGELTKEIYEEDLSNALRDIIIETIHDEVTEYFNRRDVIYNKRITDPSIFDLDPERIEIRSLIREGIIDRLISHGLLNKLSNDTNSEDNFYDLP